LARALGFQEPEFEESGPDILREILARSGLGENFASLGAKGTVFVPETPLMQFADHRFATPSGRIEVASGQAAADGLPRTPQCRSDPRPSDGKLRLLSPAHAWLLNTSFGNVGKIRSRLGLATIALHPADAAERHLAEGDAARVYNDCGELCLAVTISSELPRGVALTHKGRWLTDGARSANVNILNPGEKSDMGESTAVHSVEVSVARMPEEPGPP
jgi:anaerobic selenocysteine-containing dehydrogenase